MSHSSSAEENDRGAIDVYGAAAPSAAHTAVMIILNAIVFKNIFLLHNSLKLVRRERAKK
jgi:hypothetical protein